MESQLDVNVFGKTVPASFRCSFDAPAKKCSGSSQRLCATLEVDSPAAVSYMDVQPQEELDLGRSFWRWTYLACKQFLVPLHMTASSRASNSLRVGNADAKQGLGQTLQAPRML